MYIEVLNKFQQDLSSRLRDIDVNIIIIKIKQTPGQTPVLKAFFRGRGRGSKKGRGLAGAGAPVEHYPQGAPFSEF